MKTPKNRPNYMELSGKLTKKLAEISQILNKSSLDNRMINLINIRASQINGCTFCNDMHVKEAKIEGERELRIYHLSTWKDSNLFTDKEKAVLEWTEAVTNISSTPPSEEQFERIGTHLSQQEISDLTFAIAIINAWNRLATALSSQHGAVDYLYGLDRAGLN